MILRLSTGRTKRISKIDWHLFLARLEMLEEAIEVITLHTGEQITWSPLHRRQRPRLHDARLAGADLCVRFRAGRETGSPAVRQILNPGSGLGDGD